MTCIIGLTENGVTWMGGDSLATSWYDGDVIQERKIFKLLDTSNAILGFSGSVRDLNILHYAENLIDKRDEPDIDHKYIVTKFIPSVSKLLGNNGRNISDKGINEFESYFLLAYKDKLWKIENNYAVLSHNNKYESIGCGCDYALGSLYSTEQSKLTPVERIHMALQAASKFSVGVASPFYIINTKNDEVVEFKE